MAVKKQDGKNTAAFAPRHCTKCSSMIEKHADGTALRTITFDGPRKTSVYSWVHKKCLDTK